MSSLQNELYTYHHQQAEIKRLNELLEAAYSIQEAQVKEIQRLREVIRHYEMRGMRQESEGSNRSGSGILARPLRGAFLGGD